LIPSFGLHHFTHLQIIPFQAQNYFIFCSYTSYKGQGHPKRINLFNTFTYAQPLEIPHLSKNAQIQLTAKLTPPSHNLQPLHTQY
jgi:hypothetical protein